MLSGCLGSWLWQAIRAVPRFLAGTDSLLQAITLSVPPTHRTIENPFTQALAKALSAGITFPFTGLLGAIFPQGVCEAMGIAVALEVGIFLLNAVVVGAGLCDCAASSPLSLISARALVAHGNLLARVGVALPVIFRSSHYLRDLETGVAAMPSVQRARRHD